MPLPFDFEEGKGVLDLLKNKPFLTDSSEISSYLLKKNCFLNQKKSSSTSFGEPTSVLDSASFPSRPASSSSLGGGASSDTAGFADANPSPKWHQQDSTSATSSNGGGAAESELLPVLPPLEIFGAAGKCSMADWGESVMSGSPGQEQSILRWIMGDVEDPSGTGNLNKVLQIGGGAAAGEFEFGGVGGGPGAIGQGFGGGDQFGAANFMSANPNFPDISSSECISLSSSNPSSSVNLQNSLKFPVQNNLSSAIMYPSSQEIRPFNPQLLMNQNQAQHFENPSFILPLSYAQQEEQNLLLPPQAKRHNPGGGGVGPDFPIGPFMHPHQLQVLPHYVNQNPKIGIGDELQNCHQQQPSMMIIDQLYKAAELVQTGNPLLAQGILARLNHQLSPIGKPFYRAAFYFKEALQLLLQTNPSTTNSSPLSLIFKIAAYKSYSEISPLIQFANFTCNQAILDAMEGFYRIHIVDFDIGYGGQWASLMQELAIRSGGAPLLKITALASPSTHDQLELGITRENLIQFASEINIPFEFEVMSIDSLNSCSWSVSLHPSENEGLALNLPVSVLSSYQVAVPIVLRFVKQLCPRIVVSVDRGCDRNDLPFPNHIIQALQSYSNLLESLDAVNVNLDALQKIERFLFQPGIEKIVTGRFRSLEKTQHWRTLFLSSGFSPVMFSNFAESQAECVVKRTPVRGFQVEKRQSSSLALCWQWKELVSASAWRC